MAFNKITLQIFCLINLFITNFPRSTSSPQNICVRCFYGSSYSTFKPSSPGTNYLRDIPSTDFIINWYMVLFGTILVISNIGLLLHLTWMKISCFEDYEKPHKEKLKAKHSSPIRSEIRVFTFADLEEATFGFLEETKFAKGGSSVVYRGCFSEEQEVAIKRAKKVDNDTELCFQMELTVLTEICHQNLVNLIGYSVDKNERILVFNYMKNGCLYDHLYNTKYRPDSVFNTWKLRIKILQDCAKGIECLHKHANRGFIHGDIKASNILLDENWNAYIADLGLAMVGPESENERVFVAGPGGTDGYMDPECNEATRSVTLKTDVFAFGVVMMEILTAKGVFSYDEGAYLSDYMAAEIVGGEFWKYLDKRLESPVGVDAQVVQGIAKLAERCVRRASVPRPTISEVVEEIQYILNLYD